VTHNLITFWCTPFLSFCLWRVILELVTFSAWETWELTGWESPVFVTFLRWVTAVLHFLYSKIGVCLFSLHTHANNDVLLFPYLISLLELLGCRILKMKGHKIPSVMHTLQLSLTSLSVVVNHSSLTEWEAQVLLQVGLQGGSSLPPTHTLPASSLPGTISYMMYLSPASPALPSSQTACKNVH
jgi:hypothetical protein